MAVILTEPPRSRGAATIAALQPVDVSMTTRAGRDVVIIRPTVLDLGQVAAMSSLTRADLISGLDCRRAANLAGRKPRPHHLPRPVREDPRDATWEQPGMVTWLWRMGLHADGHRDIPLIGYLGLSVLTGLTERKLISRAATRLDVPRARDMPAPVLEITMGAVVVALFDRRAAVQWAVWTGLMTTGDIFPTLRAAVRG
jgi:hypothetical protein